MPIKKKILSVLLTLIIVVSFTVPTLATTSPTITRLAGTDRYATAVAIAKQGWTQSDYAVLAYGENFPDALAAVVLAKKYNAPILLTSGSSLPDVTKQVLTDLKVKNVFIIGGIGVIPTSIESELQSMGITPTRIAGQDRYETDYLIAQQLNVSKNTPVVISFGENFPDALAISSFAAYNTWPILLVQKDSLSDKIKDFLTTDQPSKIYITGGIGAISSDVEVQIQSLVPNAQITRFSGQDRFDTTSQIVQTFAPKPNNIYLASGNSFADALAGSVIASRTGDPILLVDSNSLIFPTALTPYLTNLHSANVNPNIICFGGYGAVKDTVTGYINDFIKGTITKDSIALIDNITISVNQNDSYLLPSTVKAKFYDGTTRDVAVKWNTSMVDASKTGTYYFSGTVNGYSNRYVTLTLNVLGKIIYINDIIFLQIYKGDTISLPKTVKAQFSDGTEKDVPISWDNPSSLDPNKSGNNQYLNGTVSGYNDDLGKPKQITLYLHVRIPSTSSECPINILGGHWFYGQSQSYSTGITPDIIGTPQLTLVVENVSDKDIAAFEFTAKLYDSFDRPVYQVGTNDNTFRGIYQDSPISSGENPFSVSTYNLVLYDLATQAKNIKITKVKFTDGTEWDS